MKLEFTVRPSGSKPLVKKSKQTFGGRGVELLVELKVDPLDVPRLQRFKQHAIHVKLDSGKSA